MSAQRRWTWRLVFIVQRLISLAAPPLHSIRWKLFVAQMLVVLLPLGFLALAFGGLLGTGYINAEEEEAVQRFALRSLPQLLTIAATALVLAMAVAWMLSAYITRIVSGLASRAERIAAGESNVRLETWTRSELGALARAVERMRVKLEGKAYIEEMATNLSHELKTPLASIRGAAEVLEDGALADPAARSKFLGNILSEVQRLDRLVADLLKLSRLETKPERLTHPVDLSRAAREIGSAFAERAADAGVDFAAGISDRPVRFCISELHFRQLLGNLLDNALQFTPAGGTIRLSIRPGEIRVADEGAGIEPDLLPKIFDRFFTTENPRTGQRGSGLGLSIAKSITESAGAAIEVQSQPGRGTEFVLRFPE